MSSRLASGAKLVERAKVAAWATPSCSDAFGMSAAIVASYWSGVSFHRRLGIAAQVEGAPDTLGGEVEPEPETGSEPPPL